LINLGHERVGFVGGSVSLVVTLDRLEGYRQALHYAGLPFDARLVRYGDFRQEDGAAAMDAFLALQQDRPTGIFAANDLMAIGAMQAVEAAGLSVPQDCSIVGSNDSPVASLVSPRLTSSRAPYFELAREAAQALLAQLEGGEVTPVKKLLPCALVVRNSTALISKDPLQKEPISSPLVGRGSQINY
ncbi:MAG: substrate-binding domain-containing protein, partial [Chloroflexi bacterium]|nr:substrate-binding domain-containing protein [Chloroflexota bacterium]